MRYADAVASAPPGSRTFCVEDIGRLSPSTLSLLLDGGPAAPPLDELALGLGDRPEILDRFPNSKRSRELRQRAKRPADGGLRAAAGERLVRGLFWFLVYELQPERWLRLAEFEPLHPRLPAALGARGTVIEVGAGGGRLTDCLLGRAGLLVAVEPSPALRRRLHERLGRDLPVRVVAGLGQALPVGSGVADLVVSCASFGPDAPIGGPAVLEELERCARPGGVVALVSPENPEWFQARGYKRRTFPGADAPRQFPADLEEYFGPPQPMLNELLWKRV